MSALVMLSRAEAKAKGLPRYYPGTPCKRGHLERYVYSGRCVASAPQTSQT